MASPGSWGLLIHPATLHLGTIHDDVATLTVIWDDFNHAIAPLKPIASQSGGNSEDSFGHIRIRCQFSR